MKAELVIKILFVDKSVDQAEQIISSMRNAGIAVRPTRATKLEEVVASLQEHGPDMVLYNDAIDQPSLPELAAVLNADSRDIALIALSEHLDEDKITALYLQGARAVAMQSQPRQILAVIEREFDALNMRRQVRRLETALRESERRCDTLLDSSNDAIAYVHGGMHVRANRTYLETFGYTDFDELLGLPVLDMIGNRDAEAFKTLLRSHARDEIANTHLPLQARRADGSQFDATVEFSHATFEGEPCLQLVFRRQQLDPELLEQLQHDSATGLYNRARLLECIDHAVAAAVGGQKGGSLVLIEPDNWSAVTKQIGLSHTDPLLAQIAARIRTRLDQDDHAGMLAAHTFGVMLHPRDDDRIREWMHSLQQDIAGDIFDLGTHSVTVTASIGGSLLGEKNATTELLLNRASNALLEAQSQGVGASVLFDPGEREKADQHREQQWLELINQALLKDHFKLYQQSIISLQDASGVYAEILLRMHGPQGEVMPGFFLPLAEKHGLGGAIDRWVIRHALRTLRALDAQGQAMHFFVRLTAESIQDTSLLGWLAEQIRSAPLRKSQLILEMTESKVITLLRPAQAFVEGWRKLGGRFALSQFGSGLNSFQLLNHVDADYLKIDRSFMANLPQSPENQKAIAEICNQARELKRQTIAEWVEDAASTSVLFGCGVDFVQGNFLQAPQCLITQTANAA